MFENLAYDGIEATGASSPAIKDCQFHGTRIPVSFELSASPSFSGNTLGTNGANAFGVHGSCLNATLSQQAFGGIPNIPYYVCGDAFVNGTLTIEPGVIIKLWYTSIGVSGSLHAVGTVDEPIVFTSLVDDTEGGDTNGDGAASVPGSKDWYHLYFGSGSSGVVQHCRFKHGGRETRGMLDCDGASPDILDCEFRNGRFGVRCLTAASPRIAQCKFFNLVYDGIYADGLSSPTISFCCFAHPVRAGVNSLSAAAILAEHNYWDSADGPSGSGPGSGVAVSDNVDYEPWLDECSSYSAPLLSWVGDESYSSDGVAPDSGGPGTRFVFRVRYQDLDGDLPLSGYPRVYLSRDGVAVPRSPFPMVPQGPGLGTEGRVYATEAIPLENEGTHVYRFEAVDSTGQAAVGAPTQERQGPTVGLFTVANGSVEPAHCLPGQGVTLSYEISNLTGEAATVWPACTLIADDSSETSLAMTTGPLDVPEGLCLKDAAAAIPSGTTSGTYGVRYEIWSGPADEDESSLISSQTVTGGLAIIGDSGDGIPATALQVGALTIRAERITETAPGYHEAEGNVTINDIVRAEGKLFARTDNLRVWGDCELHVDNLPYVGRVCLYQGAFEFEAAAAVTEGLRALFGAFSVAGLGVTVTQIGLVDGGVDVRGRVEVPLGHTDLRIDLDTDDRHIMISQTHGVEVIGELRISRVGLPGGLELKTLVLQFDTTENGFRGDCEFVVPSGETIEAGLGVRGGYLDYVSLDVDGLDKMLLPSPPVFLQRVHGSLDKLRPGPPLPILNAGAGLTLGPEIAVGKITSLRALRGDLEIWLHGNGYFRAEGGLSVIHDDFRLAQGTLEYRPGQDITVDGNVNIAEVFIVNGCLRLTVNQEIFAHLTGELRFPQDWPIVRGHTIVGGRAYLEITEREQFIGAAVQLNPFGWPPLEASVEYNLRTREVCIPANHSFKASFCAKSQEILPSTVLPDVLDVPSGGASVILRIVGADATPACSLISPDATIITPDDARLATDMAYGENLTINEAWFAVGDPVPGPWQFDVTNLEGTGDCHVELFVLDEAPAITLTDPEGDVVSAGNVPVRWVDDDPDGDATVSVYYDADDSGADGVLIRGEIEASDTTNAITWDTANVQSGTYHVYAVIRDAGNMPRVSYAPGSVTVNNPNAPETPENVWARSDDAGIFVGWDPVVDADRYTVYYGEAGRGRPVRQSVSAGLSAACRIGGLAPGRAYRLCVSATGAPDLESHRSDPVYCVFLGSTNCPPRILSLPPSKARAGSQYSYEVQATDRDGDVLSFALRSAPAGMRVASDGHIMWSPGSDDLGPHDIAVRVSDGKGGEDSQNWRLMVFSADIPNVYPCIVSQPGHEASVDDAYHYQIEAVDADRDPLAYSLLRGPDGMEIDAATGLLTWTATAEDHGEWEVRLEVSDGNGGSVRQTFEIWTDSAPPRDLRWVQEPEAAGPTSIQMQVRATDETGGVEYRFETGDGDEIRPWMAREGLSVDHLSVNAQYSFQFAARDGSLQRNQSELSEVRTAWTYALQPGEPELSEDGKGVALSLAPNDGNPDHTEYAIRCRVAGDERYVAVDGALVSSPVWQTEPDWGAIALQDLTDGMEHLFDSKARNGARRETQYSTAISYISGDNTAPRALPQTVRVEYETAKVIALSGRDPQDDPITYSLSAPPAHGSCEHLNSATGALVYTPQEGYRGLDSFEFTVNDGQLDSPPARVDIDIRSAPTLWWTGDPGYETDGVHPEEGLAGQPFAFCVLYRDADGHGPLAGYPKLHVRSGAIEIPGSPFSMELADPEDAMAGLKYAVEVELAPGTDYAYFYQAYDSTSDKANGAPVSPLQGPRVFNGIETSETELTVPEGGQTSLSVRPMGEPESEVRISVAILAGDADIQVAPSELVFTADDYDEAQTVTVSAALDGDCESGTATIRVSSAGFPSVNVTVTELEPAISVEPEAVPDFGVVRVGLTVTMDLTVTNEGGGTLIGDAAVAPPFAIVSGGHYELQAGGTQQVTVGFTPTEVGEVCRTVTFTGTCGGTRRDVCGEGTDRLLGSLELQPVSAEGALVKVVPKRGKRLRARIDAEGRFSLKGIPPEDIKRITIKRKFKSKQERGAIYDQGLTGRLEVEGEPVASARVVLKKSGLPDEQTDEQGEFAFIKPKKKSKYTLTIDKSF